MKLLPPLVMAVVLGVYLWSPNPGSRDSRWTLPTALSILLEGNTDLDEYLSAVEREGYYGVERCRGHLYAMFPVGVPVAALPLVALADGLGRLAFGLDLEQELQRRSLPGLERLIASVLTAAAATLVFVLARQRSGRIGPALGLAAAFAFGTSAWSTASRGLWQHAPGLLALTAALWLLLQTEDRPSRLPWVAVLLGCALAVRPTNGIPLVVLSGFVLLRHPGKRLSYLLAGGLPLLALAAYNMTVYGLPLAPYYLPRRVAGSSHLWEALAGNLFSPARGLLIYSPILILSGYGLILLARREKQPLLAGALGLTVGAHWVVISLFPHWWGGHSYGPRLMTETVPFLLLLLLPVAARLAELEGTRRLLLGSLLILLLAGSIGMHRPGAMEPEALRWNTDPVNVDRAPERLWDWSDPPFRRGGRR